MLIEAANEYSDSSGKATTNLSGSRLKTMFEVFNFAGVIGFGDHQVGIKHWAVTHGIRITYGFLDIYNGLFKNGFSSGPYKPTNAISAGYLLSISYKSGWKPKKAGR